MYEYLTNPALIYQGPSARAASLLTKQRAPLILVHDGGGTNFSYHLLNPIDRPLWGIENARLHDGGWWEGGIAQMAEHYVGLLAKILPEGGDILLGGWSLGGILSLEMAHQIALAGRRRGRSRNGSSASSSGASTPAAAPKFRVIGMVFIDTVFPLRLAELRGPLPNEPVFLTPEQSKAMVLKDKVDLNMTHARMMVQSWDIPRWEGLKVPPTILMRAKEFVSQDPTKTFVDYVREFKLLGWDDYNKEHGNFIQDVVEVEGHHFSIFNMKNLDDVTAKVRDAADELDPLEF
ncbi:alpha/beta-hydrolase [Annulohypoxylon bovei var. microspora]|nr:alpha/beta-hydrolase [Annulohypoxylon bovei var. microspora]